MVVYLIAFILTSVFANALAKYGKRIKRTALPLAEGGKPNTVKRKSGINLTYILLILLAVFPLFFISAVRYDVGTDYLFTYVPNFYEILAGRNPYAEVGFNLFNRAIQLFTDNPQWLFVVTSLIFVSLMIMTIVRYSHNVIISVAVVLFSCIFFASLNNVRQAVAVVIVFAAIPFIVRGNHFKFILCLLIAYCFHKSAVIMIFPYIVANSRTIKNYFLPFAIAATLAMPVLCSVLKSVLVNTKYYYYFVSDFNNGQANHVNIIYNLFFLIVAYVILGNRRKMEKYAYVLLVMQFSAFWISGVSLFIRISEMISRITVFFQVFQILLIPYCVSVQRNSANKAAVALFFLAPYALYMYYYIILNNYHAVLPYKWIF